MSGARKPRRDRAAEYREKDARDAAAREAADAVEARRNAERDFTDPETGRYQPFTGSIQPAPLTTNQD